MLDIKYIVEHPDEVKKNCERRKTSTRWVDEAIQTYLLLKEQRSRRDQVIHQQREVGKEIAKNKTPELLTRAQALRGDKTHLEAQCSTQEALLENCLKFIPNLTHPEVKDEQCILKERMGGFAYDDFTVQDHVRLAEKLDIVDFATASSIAGSKFYYLKNEAVILENALISFAFDVIRKHGFSLFHTPDLALTQVVEEMGFNPRGENSQIYSVKDTDLCLIGTSEITLGAMHRDCILDKNKLPLRYGGISHCFRREAGAPGKDAKGLYRVHQFTKVEMFVFCIPEQSEKILDELVAIEESIYQQIGLPYRITDIPPNDLGSPAYRKFDIEVWMPGRNEWGEVTSASNCTDYQSRRLKTRYQGDDPKDRGLVHTLNGTAIAVPRVILAILENFQRADGSVLIPEVLRPYCGFEVIKYEPKV